MGCVKKSRQVFIISCACLLIIFARGDIFKSSCLQVSWLLVILKWGYILICLYYQSFYLFVLSYYRESPVCLWIYIVLGDTLRVRNSLRSGWKGFSAKTLILPSCSRSGTQFMNKIQWVTQIKSWILQRGGRGVKKMQKACFAFRKHHTLPYALPIYFYWGHFSPSNLPFVSHVIFMESNKIKWLFPFLKGKYTSIWEEKFSYLNSSNL